jgi:hypothetical protein
MIEFSVTPLQHKQILIQYMFAKMAVEDWHGVSDACNDIRELEAKYPELKNPTNGN